MAIQISGSTIIDNSRVIVNASRIGIGTTNPAAQNSLLAVGGTITEFSNGQYWNVVSQADVGIGASQVPLNQYLGQLAFLDEYSPSGLRRSGGGADDVTVTSNGFVGIASTNPISALDVNGSISANDYEGNFALDSYLFN